MLLERRTTTAVALGAALSSLVLLAPSAARAQDGPRPPSEAPEAEPPQGIDAGEADPAVDGEDSPEGGDAGHGSITIRIGFYQNDDGGDGNPFLDEEETVIEPVIIFEYNLTDRLTLNGSFSYDHVSSASIDRLANFAEQSGASGDYYFGAELGATYELTDDVRLGGRASVSAEYDYFSIGLGLDLAIDMNRKNTTLKLGLTGYFDQVDVIRFNGKEEGNDDRTSLTLNVGIYQVLTPTVHAEVGFTAGYQTGFLETAFNAVVLEDAALPPNPLLANNARGIEINEELPDDRLRGAVFGKIRKYFETGTGLELGMRVYADDWGIFSASIEPRLYQWIVRDVLMARLRYRFYIQTASDFYEDSFFVQEKFRTQDSDLGDFTAHSIGLKFILHITEHQTIDLSGDYVIRDDGIDQIIAALGWRMEF